MLTIRTETGLREAWCRIHLHAGNHALRNRIAAVCPAVRLLGNGPFGWIELQRLVGPLGMRADDWATQRGGSGTVLVGDYGWTESQLVEVVLACRGARLRLTCQQDLVYELLALVDPDSVQAELRAELCAIRAEHSALKWIAKKFGWAQVVNHHVPSGTVAPAAPEPLSAEQYARRSGWASTPNWSNGVVPLEGVLQASGYCVGWSGLGTEDRRRALRTVIEEVLPRGFQASYADQWGPPLTPRRLLKTADTLAALSRNAQRRNANMERAIADWEGDLAWLRLEYAELARAVVWPNV